MQTLKTLKILKLKLNTKIKSEKEMALEYAIQKWKTVVANGGHGGMGRCGLCEYYKGKMGFGCKNEKEEVCPIHAAGFENCSGTPYIDYVCAWDNKDSLEAAKKELAFLISLRPKKKFKLF